MTRNELEYSALKPEQLEVITAFVGGREVFVVVSLQLGSGKASAYMYTHMLANSL